MTRVDEIIHGIKEQLKESKIRILENQPEVHTEQCFKEKLKEREERLKAQCEFYNSLEGYLKGYDCPICKNKGQYQYYKDGSNHFMACECTNTRNMFKRAERSGLGDLFRTCTFEKYKGESEWQNGIKNAAYDFSNNSGGNWFYIGGQVGSGKTHICTAIVVKFIEKGIESRYMLWRDEIVNLKAIVMNEEEYSKAINPLKTTGVLYIDDFFKTEKGKKPTTAEINIAFEILNYRYMNQNLITIISSERSIDELIDIDEAVGSRIYARTRKYCIYIKPDREKNYRLRG